MFFRFRRFAFELAGRLPWLAFLITRCGLAMFSVSPKKCSVAGRLSPVPSIVIGNSNSLG
jgi:hypothetical protein